MISFAISIVLFARLGHGGDAIVHGDVLRSIAGVPFLYAVTSWRDHLAPCRLALGTMTKLLRFGVPFTIASVFHLGGMSWDNAFMGRAFDEATVGVYNQAYRLAELPATSSCRRTRPSHVTPDPVPPKARPAARCRRAPFRSCSLTPAGCPGAHPRGARTFDNLSSLKP